jgi:hypothetical protein
MEEALIFFRAFEAWIYLLLGFGALLYGRKFATAWAELRGAGFGLERENAQHRLNQAASMLVLVLTLAVSEFVVVSFIAPTVPVAVLDGTPTLNLFPSVTPAPTTEGTPDPNAPPSATPLPPLPEGCTPGQIEITAPQDGQEVSGVVELIGSANIPNFGYYVYEMKRSDEDKWATIQAASLAQQSAKLGDWDTRRLVPGEYQLRLVVSDNLSNVLPPCVVTVYVVKPPEETPNS